jgi:hypothetical protein
MRLILCLAAASIAYGADHADLSGVWQTADAQETITIRQKDGSVEIAESGKESKEATEIHCNTVGQACKVKGGEVSFWYNGETLVMMQSLHGNSQVTKRRLKLSEDGHGLEVETVHISPAGATEKVTMRRQSHT